MPSIIKPNIFLISIIHEPARGNKLMELEKVPIIKSGMLKPRPKVNNNMNPKILLPNVATMLRRSASPGETHGEAIVPLAAPKRNVEARELLLTFVEGLKNEGTYIS